MSTLSTNIKNRRNELNMTQEELAKKTGYKTKGAISRIEKGDRDLSQSQIEIFAKALQTTPAYLMGWEDDKNIDDIPGIIKIQKAIRIPIIGEIACGQPIFASQNYEGYFLGDPDIVQADFALRAEGDSMINANIHSGDLVLFRKTNQAENGKIVAVIIEDTATLKKLRKSKDTIILMPENENYDPIIISKNDHKNIIIIGEMVAVLQKRSE